MSLIKWSESPFDAMERLFYNTIDDLDTRLTKHLGVNPSFTPNLDISEDAENFYIIAELPGMKDEDVKVTVDEDVLTISGKKENRNEKKEQNYHKVERNFGSFVRSLSLPANVKATAVVGSFKDGLLELTLPKIVTKTAAPREIPLNSAKQVTQNGHKVVA
jgi:HSP20 family protein